MCKKCDETGVGGGDVLKLLAKLAGPDMILRQFNDFCIENCAAFLRVLNESSKRTAELIPDTQLVSRFAIVAYRTTKDHPERAPFIVTDTPISELITLLQEAETADDMVNEVALVGPEGIEGKERAKSAEEALDQVRAYRIMRAQNHKVTNQ